MPLEFTTSYLKDALALFGYYKKLGERAMEHVSDQQLFEVMDEEMNSIAIIVKHMCGNMRSRGGRIFLPVTARNQIAIATPNSLTRLTPVMA